MINIHGVPDNLAWTYLLERGIRLTPWQIGLFVPDTRSHLPPEILTYLKKITVWHDEYAKNYRDALAHRIPPYVAPAVLTPEEEQKYHGLGEQFSVAAKAGNFERALALMEEHRMRVVVFAWSLHSRFWTRRPVIL